MAGATTQRMQKWIGGQTAPQEASQKLAEIMRSFTGEERVVQMINLGMSRALAQEIAGAN